jgi:hypothetical protein
MRRPHHDRPACSRVSSGRCNVADERLEIVHQGDAVGSIIVCEDAGLEYVRKRLGGQRGRDQVCLDLIVRKDPKPNINQPTMPAVIAPASVASICAAEELLRAGG